MAKRKKKPEMESLPTYGVFVFLGSLYLFVHIFFPNATGLPVDMIGLSLAVIAFYGMSGKTNHLLESLHAYLLIGGILIACSSLLWLIHLCTVSVSKELQKI